MKAYRKLAADIRGLPASGILQQRQSDLADQLAIMDEKLGETGFVKHAADLNTALTQIRSQTKAAAISMQAAHLQLLKDTQAELHLVPEWSELTQEEQVNCLSELDGLRTEATQDVAGILQLVNCQFVISSKANDLKKHIQELGAKRKRERLDAEKKSAQKEGRKKLERTFSVPATITSTEALKQIIGDLQEIQDAATGYGEISVAVNVE